MLIIFNIIFFFETLVIADFTTHGWSHIYGLPCPSADSLDPMDSYYPLMFQVHPLKTACLLLYATFKPILTCTHDFWPQTHVHRDMCISQNIFGFFLIGFRRSWLLAFHIPWDRSDSTLHYLVGVLYKEPLGYIERGGIEEKRNYSPLLPQFAYTWVYIPLSLCSTLCYS